MPEVNLLRALPVSKRNVERRKGAKNPDVVAVAKQFGEMYFDGPREYGYGGYRYDGRWLPVARDIIEHFDLKDDDRVLDIGCAKGFLLKDLLRVNPNLKGLGFDISRYAIRHAEPEVRDLVTVGTLPDALHSFPAGYFDCVLCINTLHNLHRDDCVKALTQIQRISGGRAFVQVDSYHTPEQKQLFEDWVLTAEFHGYPDDWLKVFDEAGYTGDYYWTVIEE